MSIDAFLKGRSGKKRSLHARLVRLKKWNIIKARKAERTRMWREAYRDKEKAESVAQGTYPLLDISKGEVISQGMSYVNPSLKRNLEENRN